MFLRLPIVIIQAPGPTRRLKGTDIAALTVLAEVRGGGAGGAGVSLPNPARVFFFGAEAFRLQTALERLPEGGVGTHLLVGGSHQRALPGEEGAPAVDVMAAWFVVEGGERRRERPIEVEELELVD